MNGNAGRNQYGLPWVQADRRVNAGAQVHAGRTGRGVLRQGDRRADAVIENLELNGWMIHSVIKVVVMEALRVCGIRDSWPGQSASESVRPALFSCSCPA